MRSRHCGTPEPDRDAGRLVHHEDVECWRGKRSPGPWMLPPPLMERKLAENCQPPCEWGVPSLHLAPPHPWRCRPSCPVHLRNTAFRRCRYPECTEWPPRELCHACRCPQTSSRKASIQMQPMPYPGRSQWGDPLARQPSSQVHREPPLRRRKRARCARERGELSPESVFVSWKGSGARCAVRRLDSCTVVGE